MQTEEEELAGEEELVGEEEEEQEEEQEEQEEEVEKMEEGSVPGKVWWDFRSRRRTLISTLTQ
jgi:hypothetical protein